MLTIDLHKILRNRVTGVKRLLIPGFVISMLERIIHQDELNHVLRQTDPATGTEFACKVYDFFELTLTVKGAENIPDGGRYVFASNHPLGGLDGIGLIKVLGEKYGDDKLRFLVNDMLMNVEPLRPVFLPINKYGKQGREAAKAIAEAYASADKQILIFPAGLVSRLKPGGEISDLEWQKSFILKAIESKRDIIPVRFEGCNRKRFYLTSKWRTRLGLKVNIEQALLPAELCAARGKTFEVEFSKPISWQKIKEKLDSGTSPLAMAAALRKLSN